MMKNEERIIKFSPDQILALERFELFKKQRINRNDYNTRVMVIIGAAGSGKTTLIKYGLEDYLKKDEDIEYDDEAVMGGLFSSCPDVIGICLAHQAKKNLRKSITHTKTFASYFGMKEVHGDEGQRSFEIDAFALRTALCKEDIAFAVHDEVSMYDQNMIDILLKETHPDTKIILMGDAAQLPPINTVGDDDSPAFTMFTNVVELTERHRQSKENPILALSDIFREEIRGKQNMKRCIEAMKKDNVVNGVGFRNIFYREFLKDYKNITSDYKQAKLIAYRRATVSERNLQIRAFLYPKADNIYVPGEIVYMNDTFKQESKQPLNPDDHLDEAIQNLGKEQMYYCYNSDEYTIESVETDIVSGVKVYKIFFDKSDRPDITAEKPYFPMLHPSGVDAYNKIFYQRRAKALNEPPGNHKKSYWKYFYDFKNQFADCSYGYALTGHKAQGSGYKYIYIDVNDILTVGPISDKRKLQALYTAMTRATDLVSFLKTR